MLIDLTKRTHGDIFSAPALFCLNPQYSLLMNLEVPSLEQSMPAFKRLVKEWNRCSFASTRSIIEPQLLSLGWMRKGGVWLHKEQLLEVVY
jgi:hypothetical protein